MTTRSEKRVIPLELFFDLVFVFALTQVTALMSEDPTWQGLGRGMLVLAALWWAWGAYAWLTNEIEADEDLPRLAMFTSMTAMLIAALAVPNAFGDDGVIFACAYFVVRVMHIVLFAQATPHSRSTTRPFASHVRQSPRRRSSSPPASSTGPCKRRSGSGRSRLTTAARWSSA